jgi:hypothetical protein
VHPERLRRWAAKHWALPALPLTSVVSPWSTWIGCLHSLGHGEAMTERPPEAPCSDARRPARGYPKASRWRGGGELRVLSVATKSGGFGLDSAQPRDWSPLTSRSDGKVSCMTDFRQRAEARRARVTITRRGLHEPDTSPDVRGAAAVSLVQQLTLVAAVEGYRIPAQPAGRRRQRANT